MTINLPLILLVAALIFFSWAGFLIWQRYTPRTVSFSHSAHLTPGNSVALGIAMPDLGVSLSIIPGVMVHNQWPVTPKGVIYLSSTPSPGTAGNSVLYGHNWPNLLGNLKRSRLGQRVIIYYANGSSKTFLISQVSVVGADDVAILKPTSDTRLTIYTCTGFLDSQRLVVTALEDRQGV